MKIQKKYQWKMQVKSIAKIIIFHLLLTLRKPILFLSKFIALFFLFFAFVFFIEKFHEVRLIEKIIIFFSGIVFTVINWFYDDLIFYFQPEDKEIILYR